MEAKNSVANSLNLLEVFQVCDSTFPIGTFNHSFGMENYLHEKKITNTESFAQWLQNFFQLSFAYGEGLLTLLVYRALEDGDIEKIWEYDQIMNHSTFARETRTATKLIAKQMQTLIEKVYGSFETLATYSQLVGEGTLYGNPAIVFALFAHHKGLPAADAFLMYGYSVASTLVQNAVRAIPLGQSDGQIVLHNTITLLGALYDEVKDLDEDYLGANGPGIELAQILHETQGPRLFMS